MDAIRTKLISRLVAAATAGVVALAGNSAIAAEQNLSWLGESSFTGAYPNVGAADFTNGSTDWLSQKTLSSQNNQFSIDRFGSYQALSNVPLDGVLRAADLSSAGNAARLQSELGFSVGRESFLFPVEISKGQNVDGQAEAQNSLGVKWRHRFGDSSHLTVGARYGKSRFGNIDSHSGGVSASKLASVSWTSAWHGEGESTVTGSFFVGDEKANNGSSIDASRQIYGLSVGGKWAMNATHTPFVSYRYQTGYGEAGYPATDLFELDNATHISAGWNWQVQPNWSVQAEADFSYLAPTLDLFNVNNTRLFFRTRYDFR